jgi:hypothetical protein
MQTEEDRPVGHLLSKQHHQQGRHQQVSRRQLIGPPLEARQQCSFMNAVVIIDQGISFTLKEPKSPTVPLNGHTASIDLPIPVAKQVDHEGKPCSDVHGFEERSNQHDKH